MGRIRPVMMIAGLLLGFIMISIADGYAQRDGGYDVTADLWVKAVLQVSGNPVTLIGNGARIGMAAIRPVP